MLAHFAADLHGDWDKYHLSGQYAAQEKPRVLILGGDNFPRANPGQNVVDVQTTFVRQLLRDFLVTLRDDSPDTKVLLVNGNTDVPETNLDLTALEREGLLTVIDFTRARVDDLDFVGYPRVNPGVSAFKHHEMRDLLADPYIPGDSRSRGDHSIEVDLQRSTFTENPKNTVCVFHAPPYDTNLDLLYAGEHVGSKAIRQFIETHQPWVTLHGHVHEAARYSGSFAHILGNSLCLTSGNEMHTPYLYVVSADLNARRARRIRFI
ncbi:MAG: metallophosphoesterase [Candidatus Peregrinibacteria bacterium GW2011_GWC2_39_14]|nr:MAG: Metallophosphoesterase [Candidatus Peregrinibacteria bacterium GW2011_GWA2_38_36]KKR05859.1 MAG: metallophosphoesterase [Candidatus Peregrinibacteria bacterium GW2011_GWC2_39_14]